MKKEAGQLEHQTDHFKIGSEKTIQGCLSRFPDDSNSLTIEDIISSNDRNCVWYCLRKDVIDDLYRTEMDLVTSVNRQKPKTPELRVIEDLIEANEELLREALASKRTNKGRIFITYRETEKSISMNGGSPWLRRAQAQSDYHCHKT